MSYDKIISCLAGDKELLALAERMQSVFEAAKAARRIECEARDVASVDDVHAARAVLNDAIDTALSAERVESDDDDELNILRSAYRDACAELVQLRGSVADQPKRYEYEALRAAYRDACAELVQLRGIIAGLPRRSEICEEPCT